MLIKNSCLVILILLVSFATLSAQDYRLASPDKNVQINIHSDSILSFSVHKRNEILIPKCEISLSINGKKSIGQNSRTLKVKKSSVDEIIYPVVLIKNKLIRNKYNELTFYFNDGNSVVFRAYDDAVVYRFVTNIKRNMIVNSERFDITFPDNASGWFPLLTGKDEVSERWMTHYEHLYTQMKVGELSQNRTELPFLIKLKNNKLLITESDLKDYPGLYFTGNTDYSIKAIFPPKVRKEKENIKREPDWDRIVHPESTYPYLAETEGRRQFPWRIIAIADEDIDLLNNEIVYKLAQPNQIKNTEWIRPGLVSWDWWSNRNLTGVDFRAGVNNATYKYYIDFAAKNKIPYLLIDEGWYELGDLTKENKEVDIQELVNYAQGKNVGILLWCTWKTLDGQMTEAMNLFKNWGVKGIKVDFMNRDDQDMVNFYWRCAKEAAERHLLVNFHGSHKPTGLERTFPNVVNYEGVVGMEQDKVNDQDATPNNAVTIPFIRMFNGPMDYTPGAMRNAQKKDFRAIYDLPMSQGTRCQQLAMYIIYDAPLQMLSDNPIAYEENKESLDFITSIPTTWDQTIPLSGKIGEYVVMARKNGRKYFIGAMTNWEPRDLTIELSFLPEGNWNMEIYEDGINAERNGIDYRRKIKNINNIDSLKVHLVAGGGWTARIFQ